MDIGHEDSPARVGGLPAMDGHEHQISSPEGGLRPATFVARTRIW
jgi:hypothetical protein